MKVIVDRIEEDVVVLEVDGNMVDVSILLFPNACEGDVYNISKDVNEMEKRKENITSLVNNLFE